MEVTQREKLWHVPCHAFLFPTAAANLKLPVKTNFFFTPSCHHIHPVRFWKVQSIYMEIPLQWKYYLGSWSLKAKNIYLVLWCMQPAQVFRACNSAHCRAFISPFIHASRHFATIPWGSLQHKKEKKQKNFSCHSPGFRHDDVVFMIFLFNFSWCGNLGNGWITSNNLTAIQTTRWIGAANYFL